ncbi:FAD-binding domain-containing protein [Apiospora arundinis]|uniref:FAD-binding domain-containing protein n=1 Tax=Apiospora arundinis TaxID=335852 RepID=A0ABR2JH74_9PEZI
MSIRGVAVWCSIITAIVAILARDRLFSGPLAGCRTIPGDTSWPDTSVWSQLNTTVGGKLIRTVPLAAVCHKTIAGEPNPSYDEEQCAMLRDHWFFPETHLPSPSSPMSYYFSNNSCNPWLGPDTPCTIGSTSVYVINATKVTDIQEGIRFATEHNIRLVIRNTGHDYLGKSTGAHSLTIWTHNFKSIELLEKGYSSPHYTGPAVKMGAGVEALEAYKFAASHRLVVVGGNCPTVAVAGGFTQGGGHGPLASRYGLAADQVLEWEVVSPTGEYLTVSTTDNADLFWALRGGGGGTFGVVISMTVKAFPDTYASTASMMVPNTGANADALYAAIGEFITTTLPGLVDAGAFVSWIVAPFGFMITPAVAPGVTSAELDRLLQPMLNTLKAAGLEYQHAPARHHATFLDAYQFYQQGASWNVSDYTLGGRLISRDVALQNTSAFVEVIRHISTVALFSGVSYNVGGSADEEVAVNPYFRKTLVGVALGTPLNYTDWSATLAGQNLVTNDLVPALTKLTPDGAAYLSEVDFQQPDFQRTLYGAHYPRLLEVKHKYDPAGIMYAKTAVGSEEWEERDDGRLCRVK